MSAHDIIDIEPAAGFARPLLWFHFDQNNSGGSFVVDENVCEDVFIQAHTAAEAIAKGEEFMDNSDSCPCCGNRWSFYVDDRDGQPVPMRYDVPAEAEEPMYFHKNYKLHFYDGHVETHAFGAARPIAIGTTSNE